MNTSQSNVDIASPAAAISDVPQQDFDVLKHLEDLKKTVLSQAKCRQDNCANNNEEYKNETVSATTESINNVQDADAELDQEELRRKTILTVESIKSNAEKLNETLSFEIDDIEFQKHRASYNRYLWMSELIPPSRDQKLYQHFLNAYNCKESLKNPVTTFGIDTDTYVNRYNIIKYKSSDGPNTAFITGVSEQLVIIHRLGKIFNFTFITEAYGTLKFNDLDKMVCKYISLNKIENTHKITYHILKEALKKILVSSLTTVEQAFRSNKTWVTPNFKKFIMEDLVLMQCLSGKLQKSFEMFTGELLKTGQQRIFDNTKILDNLMWTAADFEIECLIAGSIRCMTPCFILDYFNVLKSLYIYASLFEIYVQKCMNGEIDITNPDDNSVDETKIGEHLNLLAKISSIIYQNTRLYHNATGRQLPLYKENMSELAQMYYLNHTVVGPQFACLKMFELASVALKEQLKDYFAECLK